MERNALAPEHVVSCIFTATEDLDAEFPAVAARAVGFDRVPLLCAREIPVPGLAAARDQGADPLLRRRGARAGPRLPGRGPGAARGPGGRAVARVRLAARRPAAGDRGTIGRGDRVRRAHQAHPGLPGRGRLRRAGAGRCGSPATSRPTRRCRAVSEAIDRELGRRSTAIRTRPARCCARAERPLRSAQRRGSRSATAPATSCSPPARRCSSRAPSSSTRGPRSRSTRTSRPPPARARSRSALDGEDRHDLPAMLREITVATRLVIVCNPNNPTEHRAAAGRASPSFLAEVPAHVCVIVDEAYCEFNLLDDPDASIELLERHPNLVLLRTFSKVHGLVRAARRLRPVRLRRAAAGARPGPPAVLLQRARPGRRGRGARPPGRGHRARRRGRSPSASSMEDGLRALGLERGGLAGELLLVRPRRADATRPRSCEGLMERGVLVRGGTALGAEQPALRVTYGLARGERALPGGAPGGPAGAPART